MGISRYLFNDWFTATELDEVDRKLDHHRREGRRTSKTQAEQALRIEQLEHNLGRVAMLARSLAEVCLSQGVMTLETLKAKLVEVDLADGVQDGVLDPQVVLPGEARLADLKPIDEVPRRRIP